MLLTVKISMTCAWWIWIGVLSCDDDIDVVMPTQNCNELFRVQTEEIGRGKDSNVFVAAKLSDETKAAIKVYKTKKNFAKEMRITDIISPIGNSNKHFPEIFDHCLHDENPAVAMEFLEKSEPYYEKGLRNFENYVRYAKQILTAVADLHTFYIVHGDIKPDNFMISSSGDFKLIDFGNAQWIGDFNHKTLAGTPAYMAPERFTREAITSLERHIIDAWSVGVTLFWLILGESFSKFEYQESFDKVYSNLSENQCSPLAFYFLARMMTGMNDGPALTRMELTFLNSCPMFRDNEIFERDLSNNVISFNKNHDMCNKIQKVFVKFTDEQVSGGYPMEKVNGLVEVLKSLLLFKRNSRTSVLDALKNPVFASDLAVLKPKPGEASASGASIRTGGIRNLFKKRKRD